MPRSPQLTSWQAPRDLARLVVPVTCPGCGAHDVVVCRQCAAPWDRPVHRVEQHAPRLDRLDENGPLPVWATVAYAYPCRDAVLAWKDHGRQDLDDLLLPAARRAGAVLGPGLVQAAGGRLAVVPAPSSLAARRRRGRFPVGAVARAFARGVADSVPHSVVVVTDVLRRSSRTRHQAGLGARGRGARIGQIRVSAMPVRVGPSRQVWRIRPTACVLIDDVLTTGATLAACEDALVMRGAHVLSGYVLAATLPPGGTDARPAPI